MIPRRARFPCDASVCHDVHLPKLLQRCQWCCPVADHTQAMDMNNMEAGPGDTGREQTRKFRFAPRSGGDTKIGPSLARVSNTIWFVLLRILMFISTIHPHTPSLQAWRALLWADVQQDVIFSVTRAVIRAATPEDISYTRRCQPLSGNASQHFDYLFFLFERRRQSSPPCPLSKPPDFLTEPSSTFPKGSGAS